MLRTLIALSLTGILSAASANAAEIAPIPPATASTKIVPSEADDALPAIKSAYEANRESFKNCKVQFTFLTPYVDSVDNALLKKYKRITKQQRCLYYFNGEKIRYERRHDTEFRGLDESAGVRHLEQETAILANGPVGVIGLSPGIGVASVRPLAGEPAANIAITPFDLASMGPDERASPAKLMEQYLTGSGDPVSCAILRPETLFDSTCVVVEFRRASGNRIVYFLDRDRGYVPRKMQLMDAREQIQRLVLVPDVIEGKSAKWMPKRAVIINNPAELKDGAEHSIMVIEVTSIDAHPSFSDDDWTITVPDRCKVFVPKMGGLDLPSGVTRLAVDDIPRLLKGTY